MHKDAHIKSAPHCAGFSLVELMVTLAVLLFLLAVAIPSLIPFVEKTDITATSQSLREGLAIARAEAIKRASLVQVCNLDAEAMQCAGTTKSGRRVWQDGFMVFDDVDKDAEFSESVDQLLYVAHFSPSLNVDWGRGDYLVYASSGALKFGNGSFRIQNSESEQGLKLILNIVGRVRSDEI